MNTRSHCDNAMLVHLAKVELQRRHKLARIARKADMQKALPILRVNSAQVENFRMLPLPNAQYATLVTSAMRELHGASLANQDTTPRKPGLLTARYVALVCFLTRLRQIVLRVIEASIRISPDVRHAKNVLQVFFQVLPASKYAVFVYQVLFRLDQHPIARCAAVDSMLQLMEPKLA
jgi:hypothetical protein